MKFLPLLVITVLLTSLALSAPTYKPLDPNKKDDEFCLFGSDAGNYADCYHCRAGKSDYGQNYDNKDVDQTHGLRQDDAGKWKCIKEVNSEISKKDCDETIKISNCEVYDNAGLCIQCHCDFGLWYSADSTWQCIENEFRTRNCHKYDENKDCIECKWTTGNENLKFLDNAENKKQLSRDYGLYTTADNIYCVDNALENDYVSTLLTYTKNGKVANCHMYKIHSDGTKLVCQSCHNRVFDLDGNNRWANDLSYDFWINESEAEATAKSCLPYPAKYITRPELLKTLDVGNLKNIVCTGDYKIHQNLATGEYGCIIPIDKCKADNHSFVWDLEGFKKDRKWFKKLNKCDICDVDYILSADSQKCIKNDNLKNCIMAKTDKSCSKCIDETFQLILKGSEDICQLIAGDNIDNCEAYEFTNSNQTALKCNKCKYGFVEVVPKDDSTQITACKPYNDNIFLFDEYIHIETNKAQQFNRSGCKRYSEETKKCIVGNYGFVETGAAAGSCSSSSLIHNIRQLCPSKTVNEKSGAVAIPNCALYSVSEKTINGLARCMQCNTGFELDGSRWQCLSTTNASTIVENCTAMAGTWCKKCKENFQLTNENTCVTVSDTENSGFKGKNCRVAVYNKSLISKRAIETCWECEQGYIKDTGVTDCLLDKKCCKVADLYNKEVDPLKFLETDLSLVCKQGFVQGYTVNEWYKPRCVKKIDGCRYYRDNMERCFECQNGKSVTPDGNCKDTDESKMVQNIFGERIAVTEVIENCLMYSKNADLCQYCMEGYRLQIHTDKLKTQCVKEADCITKKLIQSFSLAPICAADVTLDANCEGTHYEMFEDKDKKLDWRCANCKVDVANLDKPENSYFMSNGKCTLYNDIKFKDPVVTLVTKDQLQTRLFKDAVQTAASDLNMNLLQFACNFKTNVNDDLDTYFVMNSDQTLCIEKPVGAEDNCYINSKLDKTDNKALAGNVCTQCLPGYWVNSKGNCERVTAYPFLILGHQKTGVTYNTKDKSEDFCPYKIINTDDGVNKFDTYCKKCENGYIHNGKFTKLAACYKSPHPACVIASANNKCTMCELPYRLDGADSCTLTIRNCYQYAADNKSCGQCYFGYDKDAEGLCKLLPGNCQELDFAKSYDAAGVMQIQYCNKCVNTDTKTGDVVRIPLQGTQNGIPGKYCHFGCNTYKRSPGEKLRTNQFNNWECCKCDATQFIPFGTNTDQQCKRQIIKGCAQYTADKACSKCEQLENDKYFFLGAGVTQCTKSCKINVNADTTNCATFQNNDVDNVECKCDVCKSTFYLNTDKQCISNDVKCEEQKDKDTCTKCKMENASKKYFLKGVTCEERTNKTCENKHENYTPANLNINYNEKADECISCFYGYQLNIETKQCEKETQFCLKRDPIDTKKCILCDFSTTNGYGLSKLTNSCVLNSDINKFCKTYTTVDSIENTCVQCYSNDNFDEAGWKEIKKSQVWDSRKTNKSQVCVETDYCIFGGIEGGKVYCSQCMVQTLKLENIFYDKLGKDSVCKKQGAVVDATYIPYCRRYVNFSEVKDAKNVCIECHEGYHSDYQPSDQSGGVYCMVDDSPCSLPACKSYQSITGFEYLKCNLCHNKWKYYTQIKSDTTVSLFYNLNTYSNACDNVKQYSPNSFEPSFVPYDGKDGGILNTNVVDPDIPDIPDVPTDRERYNPPVVTYGSLLGLSISALVLMVTLF